MNSASNLTQTQRLHGVIIWLAGIPFNHDGWSLHFIELHRPLSSVFLPPRTSDLPILRIRAGVGLVTTFRLPLSLAHSGTHAAPSSHLFPVNHPAFSKF
ncbi:hypothetical protein PtB15_12B135 [Puccinia triticina]|nr:hypothetical protein PtB15_12B135 [Puccinia triticina]